jgi:nucleoside-diphosphate-sugar epimerase
MRAVPILVTGVGYIGARLALDLLEQGDEVVGLDNHFSTSRGDLAPLLAHPRFSLVRGSVADPLAVRDALDRAAPKLVYHLAAQPSADPNAASAQYTERSNLSGPRVLLDALRERDVELLVLGSSFKVVGDELPECVDESQPYGRVGDLTHLSKIYLEKLAEMYAWRGGPRVVSVRLGITYGLAPVMKTNPRFQTVPNRFCAAAAAGEALRVLASRPAAFIHVRDAARAMRAACTLEPSLPYRVANAAPEVLTVSKVAALVADAAASRGLETHVDGRSAETVPVFRVPSVLERVGFTHKEEMASALPEVLDHFLRVARVSAGSS